MNQNKFKVFVCLVVGIFILTNCERELKTEIRSVAYVNLDDYDTEEISSNVLRVEIGQSSNDISMLLSITDQEGTPLENFTIGNVELYQMFGDDSIKIKIEDLYEMNKVGSSDPIAAAMTMDYSGSMGYTDIISMEEAVRTFVELKESEDLIGIIKFASYIETMQNLTTDGAILTQAIDSIANVGTYTAFYSSCEEGIISVRGIPNVIPAVIALTDGMDNRSYISLNELIELAQASQVPVYTIAYGTSTNSENELLQLAVETGGRFFMSPDNTEILNLYELISDQLRNLYVVEWNASYSSGSVITISVTVTYTAANGTFTDTVKKIFVID